MHVPPYIDVTVNSLPKETTASMPIIISIVAILISAGAFYVSLRAAWIGPWLKLKERYATREMREALVWLRSIERETNECSDAQE